MAQFTIRIPDVLRDRVRRAAREDKRSMNAEIEWLLERSLDSRQPPSGETMAAGPEKGSEING